MTDRYGERQRLFAVAETVEQDPERSRAAAGILRRRLPPHPASIGEADRLVRQLVVTAGRGGLVRPVAQLVEVLLTGAVRRARSSVDMSCTIVAGQLRFTVGDDNPVPWGPKADPQVLFDNRAAPILLDCLADTWGVIPTPAGSTAWFVLSERRTAGHRSDANASLQGSPEDDEHPELTDQK